MSTNNSSTEKTAQTGTVKKPYKTPTLRFESVFEVTALSCGKLAGPSSSCNAASKYS